MERPSIRQLECAVAVAQHLSFRKAAEACFITQPALSGQIKSLETNLGLQLFERDRRHVLVTPAGEELVARARVALAEVDQFLEAARAFHDPLAGTLRLGVIPTVAPYVLPAAVPAVRRKHKDLRLLLREERTSRLVELTRRGELELCLLALEADLADLETLPLYHDPFVFVAPEGHRLAVSDGAVRVRQLVGEEVLLLEDGHCLREQALSICQRSGARELGDFRATSLNTLTRMVSSGIGVTLLPAIALSAEVQSRDRLTVRPIEDSGARRTIGLAWRRSSPREQGFRRLGELLAANPPKGAVPLGAKARR